MKFIAFLVAALAVAVSANPTPTPAHGVTNKPIPTPPAPHKSINFREAFDQVFFAFAEEHLVRAEHALLMAQHEVNEYKQHKDAAMKERLQLLITHESNMLTETLAHLETQKTRTDFNDLELYLFEKMTSDCHLLIKHFGHLKAQL